MRVAPEFKQPLVNHLNQHLVVEVTPFPGALTRGSHSVNLQMFVEALEVIGCCSVRLLVYGIKNPLDLFPIEPANLQHPLASTNTFDLGRLVDHPDLLLVKGAYHYVQPLKTSPMFLEVGQGFGSITTNLRWQEMLVRCKVYPRVVHTIKSIRAKHVSSQPKTIGATRLRFKSLQKMLSNLLLTHWKGGLRLEVTITASSLLQARRFVEASPLLTLSEWLEPSTSIMDRVRLRLYPLPIHYAKEHAQDIVAKAQTSNLLVGRDSERST